MPLRVFLSHASADTGAAEELTRFLQEGDEIECWLDRFEIGFGENVVSRISDGLAKSDYVLLLLSPNALKSRWVEEEWTSVYSSEVNAGKTRLIPILIGGAVAPAILRNRQYFVFREGDRHGMQQIKAALLRAKPILSSSGAGPVFIGREPELRELKELLTKPGSLVTIFGMPGVGKTYLAREFVRRHGAFFESVYELDCRGRDLASLTGELASLLGLRLEGEVDQVTSELRRYLSARRCLLVLDAVVDDQPCKFVPGGRSSVLVTSRNKVIACLADYPGVTLPLFTEHEALEFFQRTLGEVPEGPARELLGKLGYLPIAVASAAGLIKHDVRYSVKSLLAALSTVQDATLPQNTVGIVLRRAIAALNPKATSLLIAFAACGREDISLAFATEIAALTASDSFEALQTLYSQSLIVEVDRASRRYRLHPLVRDVASPTLEVRRRHALCVHQHLRDSDRDLLQSAGLIAEARQALSAVTDDLELSVQIATEAGNLAYALGRMGEAFEFHVLVQDLAARAGRNDWLQTALGNQALILRAWGRLDEAMELLRKQEAISLELGDRAGLQRAYGNQALILRTRGRLEEAMALLRKQEAISLELRDRIGLQQAIGNQANVLQAWGRLEEAMELFQKQEAISQELGDRTGLQRTYGNQALILQAWGRLEEAMALFRKQEAISLELGDRRGLQRTYGNQALILQTWGRPEEAMALHKKEEAICEELGDRVGLQATYGNQALILRAWGRLEDAMALLKRQEAICEELGDRVGLRHAYSNQALILKDWGRLEEAMALLKRQEAICEELADLAGLQQSYGNQALILQASGHLQAAMELHKREERICRELGDRAGLAASLGNQTLILRNWGRLDGAVELLREQEIICRDLGDRVGMAYCYWTWGVVARARGEHEAAKNKLKEASAIFAALNMGVQQRAVLEASSLAG